VGPGARLLAQLGQRQAAQPGVDRQQRQAGGLVGVVAQLDRAHRRAAGGGGQDAAARVGEEDRVDQLRLAARELGDEGDDQLLARKPLAQRLEQVAGGLVEQVVLAQEPAQFAHARLESKAPIPEGVDAVGKRVGHAVAIGGASAESIVAQGLRAQCSRLPKRWQQFTPIGVH
jgi:hypothetical protein